MEQHVFQTGMSPVLIVEVEGDFKLKGEDVEEVTIQAASDDDLKVNQDGNQITIKCSSDLKVRAPRATSVKISQAYGDATLKAIDGEVKIETVHGNLNLRSVGPVHLGSVHGNLEARSVMGSLEVERVDGNLEARDIIGALQVKFTGGNLTIEDVEEAVDVKAEGNVIMRLDPNPGEDYSIKAGGNLTWKAPEDVSAKVEVRKADKIISSLSGVGPQRAPCSFTIGDGDALVVLEAQGNVMINPKGANLDFDFNFSAGENDAERIGLSPDAIAEQISLQLDTQMALLERQLDLEMARAATRLDSVGASPEQVERIQRRAREAGEQATQRAQEKMRLAQERLERKMAAVQQRVEQRAKQAEERAKQAEQRTQRRERRSWSFGFTMPEPPRPPTPPVPPRPPVAPGMPGVPGAAVDDKVSDDERLAVLRMLSAKKISLEQAEKLLAALEGEGCLMAAQDARRQIFDMLESGKITAAQAIELIKALGEEDEAAELAAPVDLSGETETVLAGQNQPEISEEPVQPAAPQVLTASAGEPVEPAASPAEPAAPLPEDAPAEPSGAGQGGFRNWWRYPLWIGVAVTIVGAALMYLAVRSDGFGFWFACAWFPFLFGVAVLALAWGSRQARWLHVRIRRQPGESPQRISISLPLPLRLAASVIRIFNIRTREIENQRLSDLILTLEKTSPEAPFYVHVNDSDDGEQVEIYIG